MEHIRILFYNGVIVAAVLLFKIHFGGARRKTIAGSSGTTDSSSCCILMVRTLASNVSKPYAFTQSEPSGISESSI